jgi:hypothetical protein
VRASHKARSRRRSFRRSRRPVSESMGGF